MNMIPPPPAVPPQVFVDGNVAFQSGISERNSIRQIDHKIGFWNQQSKNATVDDAFQSFQISGYSLKSTLLTCLVSLHLGCKQVDGFYLVQDRQNSWKRWLIGTNISSVFLRCHPLSDSTKNVFKAQLQRSLPQADTCKALQDQTSTASLAANPGPLKNIKGEMGGEFQ